MCIGGALITVEENPAVPWSWLLVISLFVSCFMSCIVVLSLPLDAVSLAIGEMA